MGQRIGLYAITFLLMFAVGMGTPISPLLASSIGASWVDVGLMGLAWGLALAFSSFVTGRISDRVGRRPLLVASSSVSMLAAFLLFHASTVGQLIAGRGLEGFAWACFWPPMEALATETVDTKDVGKGIGLVTTVFAFAFAMGSLAGGSISDLFGLRPVFEVYFVIAALSILTVPFIDDPRRRRIMNHLSRNPSSSRFFSRALVLGYYLGGSETFGFGTVMALLSVFALDLGIPVFWIGVVFSLFWAGRILSGTLAGVGSDRFGRKRVAVLALLVGATGFTVIALALSLFFLATGALLIGLSIGAIYPVNLAMIADNTEPQLRGGAMGIYETTSAIMFMVSSTFGGLAAEFVSPRTPYASSAFTYVACAVVLLTWGKSRREFPRSSGPLS